MRTMRKIWKNRRPRRADVANTWPPLPSEMTTTLATIVTTSISRVNRKLKGKWIYWIYNNYISVSHTTGLKQKIHFLVSAERILFQPFTKCFRFLVFLLLVLCVVWVVDRINSLSLKRTVLSCSHSTVRLRLFTPNALSVGANPNQTYDRLNRYLHSLSLSILLQRGMNAICHQLAAGPHTHQSRRKAFAGISNDQQIPGIVNGNRTTTVCNHSIIHKKEIVLHFAVRVSESNVKSKETKL